MQARPRRCAHGWLCGTSGSGDAGATEDGRAFLWGKMQSREVDEQGMHKDELWPTQVPVDGKVVQVACGQAHTCFLTGAWDRPAIEASHGVAAARLGVSVADPLCFVPAPLCVTHTDDGRLFLIGMRGRGELNDRSVEDTSLDLSTAAPRLSSEVLLDPVEVPLGPLEGKRIVQLEADTHHTYAVTGTPPAVGNAVGMCYVMLSACATPGGRDTHWFLWVGWSTDDGEVYWWGWRMQVSLHRPAAGLRVTQIARGLVHTLFLVDDA